MRSKLMRPLVILAILFASTIGIVGVEARQTATTTPSGSGTATPPPNPNCDPKQYVNGELRELPVGMNVVHSCIMYDDQGNYTIGAVYTIDSTTVFLPPEVPNGTVRGLHINGTVTISILAGSLDVALLNTCSEPIFPTCSGVNGTAMVGTVQATPPGVTWAPLPAAEVPQTLNAGDILQLENGVTITIEPGAAGATIATYGLFKITGGGGCTRNCIQPTP